MKKFWTADEIAILRAEYPHKTAEEVAQKLGCSLRRVYCKAQKLGLKKSEEFFVSPAAHRLDGQKGLGARFTKGHATWNKGIHFAPGGKSVETQFKSGHKPHGWKPIGSERVDKDGYLQRKVADTRVKRNAWKAVHVIVWEENFGAIPSAHKVVFKDGNKRNFDPQNLECISNQECMRRNTVHRLPKEIQQLCQLRGALNRQINKRSAK